MAEEVKEEAKEKKGGKKKLFLFIIIGFLIISIAGGAVFFLMGKKGEEGSEKGKATHKAKKKGEVVYYDLDPIIVNLLDPTGKRFIQVRLSLEIPDKKAEEELKKREAVIKDTIISTLSGKTVEEVIVPEAKDKLKSELLSKINSALGEELVTNIYITQYIVE